MALRVQVRGERAGKRRKRVRQKIEGRESMTEESGCDCTEMAWPTAARDSRVELEH